MKPFLIKFFAFVIPVVLIAYGADLVISQYLKKSNQYVQGEYSTWNALYDKNADSQILIPGSSRAWMHFDATRIGDSLHTKAYNLGMDGYNFWFQKYRLELAMRANPRPKLIIMSIDAVTLQKRPDLFNPNQFLPYMLGNAELEKTSRSFMGYHDYDYQIPLIRYFSKGDAVIEALKMVFNESEPKRIRGFQGQLKAWNNDFERVNKQMDSFTVPLDPTTIRIFEDFLKEIKQKKLNIIFVYSPEYIKGQNFVKNRPEIMALYNRLSTQYQIPFFNYSNDPISYDKKYFFNASHMNKMGAELFTTKLIQDLKTLNIYY